MHFEVNRCRVSFFAVSDSSCSSLDGSVVVVVEVIVRSFFRISPSNCIHVTPQGVRLS